MLVGYARVSKNEQNLDLQLDALKKAGCTEIFTDKITGTKAERKGLDQALKYIRAGDTLAEFERKLIQERTMAGLDAARARGKVGGRKKKLTPSQVAMLHKLYADKSNPIQEICDTLHISRTTFYRYVNVWKQ
jgi:DNA invertase Pin-like site-specific DNA recombinase